MLAIDFSTPLCYSGDGALPPQRADRKSPGESEDRESQRASEALGLWPLAETCFLPHPTPLPEGEGTEE